MTKLLCTIITLLLLGFVTPKNIGPILVDKGVRLEIPYSYKPANKFLKTMQQANDKLIYLAVIPTGKNGKNMMFSVSKYVSEKTSIDTAFAGTVLFKPFEKGYKLLDYGIREVNGKKLRFKKSEMTFEGKKIINTMYYFMKNDTSDKLYEIKASFEPEQEEDADKIMETIALTFTFRS